MEKGMEPFTHFARASVCPKLLTFRIQGGGGSISPLWCFSTRPLSQLFNAFKSLAVAIGMPFREAWFGGRYEKQILEAG
jgi:hypothetical protein